MIESRDEHPFDIRVRWNPVQSPMVRIMVL